MAGPWDDNHKRLQRLNGMNPTVTTAEAFRAPQPGAASFNFASTVTIETRWQAEAAVITSSLPHKCHEVAKLTPVRTRLSRCRCASGRRNRILFFGTCRDGPKNPNNRKPITRTTAALETQVEPPRRT